MLGIHNPDFPAREFMNWWKQQYISLLFEGAECPYKLLSVNKEPNYQCLNVLPVRIPSDRVLLFLFIFVAEKIQLMNWTHKFVYIYLCKLWFYIENQIDVFELIEKQSFCSVFCILPCTVFHEFANSCLFWWYFGVANLYLTMELFVFL